MKVYIYALCEPGTRTVRYIGMSKDPARRLRQHISRSNKGLDSPLGEWIRSLPEKPNLVMLCETAEAFWQDDEKTYIRAARALGMPLVNSSDGGDGTVNPPPETRAKLSAAVSGPKNGNYGKPHSIEWKQNMSRILTGRKQGPMSDETKARLSKVKTGVKLTADHIAKRSAAQRGKKRSEETRARMSASIKSAWARRKNLR